MSGGVLEETFRLERLELNLFRGFSPENWPGRIFGGQVVAQSLLAAYGTVDDRLCHSMHAYFIRPGDPKIPILFEVDRARDGAGFTTRRVIAIQNGRQIFNMSASFHQAETGYEHQDDPPPHGHWDEMLEETRLPVSAEMATGWLSGFPRPIEIRTVEGMLSPEGVQSPSNRYWLRAIEPLGEDQVRHQAALAYASDMGMLAVALRPHPVTRRTPGLQSASLDHSVWFHRPSNFNDWHLYVQDSPSAGAARGFTRGSIFTADGVLVASTAQEGLMRPPPGA